MSAHMNATGIVNLDTRERFDEIVRMFAAFAGIVAEPLGLGAFRIAFISRSGHGRGCQMPMALAGRATSGSSAASP